MALRKRARANTADSLNPPQIDNDSEAAADIVNSTAVTAPITISASSNIPEYNLRTALEALPPKDLINILITLSPSNPNITTWARKSYHSILEERTKIINFDPISKSVWHEINVKCARMKSSQQYEASLEVFYAVVWKIKSIANKVKENSSWGTKKSAMETLRKIARTICLSEGCIGSEIRKSFQFLDTLTGAMIHVLGCMSTDERADMCNVNDGRGPFSEKMEEVAKEWDGCCLCKGMSDVLDMLIGPELGDNEEEEDEENEADE